MKDVLFFAEHFAKIITIAWIVTAPLTLAVVFIDYLQVKLGLDKPWPEDPAHTYRRGMALGLLGGLGSGAIGTYAVVWYDGQDRYIIWTSLICSGVLLLIGTVRASCAVKEMGKKKRRGQGVDKDDPT